MSSLRRMAQEDVLLAEEELELEENQKTLVLDHEPKQNPPCDQSGGGRTCSTALKLSKDQRGKRRFTGILSYENELSSCESSWNFSWRLLWNVMRRRNGETRYHLPYLTEKLRTWQLRTIQELSWNF